MRLCGTQLLTSKAATAAALVSATTAPLVGALNLLANRPLPSGTELDNHGRPEYSAEKTQRGGTGQVKP
jgi:hypothetical protein